MKTLKKAAALVAAATALTSLCGVVAATSASASTTYSCAHKYYARVGAATYTEYGYYSGTDYVPSYSGFSSATIEAQCLLNDLGYGLTVDGYYGARTQAAVAAFQQYALITPQDGFVGPITWPLLRIYAP